MPRGGSVLEARQSSCVSPLESEFKYSEIPSSRLFVKEAKPFFIKTILTGDEKVH